MDTKKKKSVSIQLCSGFDDSIPRFKRHGTPFAGPLPCISSDESSDKEILDDIKPEVTSKPESIKKQFKRSRKLLSCPRRRILMSSASRSQLNQENISTLDTSPKTTNKDLLVYEPQIQNKKVLLDTSKHVALTEKIPYSPQLYELSMAAAKGDFRGVNKLYTSKRYHYKSENNEYNNLPERDTELAPYSVLRRLESEPTANTNGYTYIRDNNISKAEVIVEHLGKKAADSIAENDQLADITIEKQTASVVNNVNTVSHEVVEESCNNKFPDPLQSCWPRKSTITCEANRVQLMKDITDLDTSMFVLQSIRQKTNWKTPTSTVTTEVDQITNSNKTNNNVTNASKLIMNKYHKDLDSYYSSSKKSPQLSVKINYTNKPQKLLENKSKIINGSNDKFINEKISYNLQLDGVKQEMSKVTKHSSKPSLSDITTKLQENLVEAQYNNYNFIHLTQIDNVSTADSDIKKADWELPCNDDIVIKTEKNYGPSSQNRDIYNSEYRELKNQEFRKISNSTVSTCSFTEMENRESDSDMLDIVKNSPKLCKSDKSDFLQSANSIANSSCFNISAVNDFTIDALTTVTPTNPIISFLNTEASNMILEAQSVMEQINSNITSTLDNSHNTLNSIDRKIVKECWRETDIKTTSPNNKYQTVNKNISNSNSYNRNSSKRLSPENVNTNTFDTNNTKNYKKYIPLSPDSPTLAILQSLEKYDISGLIESSDSSMKSSHDTMEDIYSNKDCCSPTILEYNTQMDSSNKHPYLNTADTLQNYSQTTNKIDEDKYINSQPVEHIPSVSQIAEETAALQGSNDYYIFRDNVKDNIHCNDSDYSYLNNSTNSTFSPTDKTSVNDHFFTLSNKDYDKSSMQNISKSKTPEDSNPTICSQNELNIPSYVNSSSSNNSESPNINESEILYEAPIYSDFSDESIKTDTQSPNKTDGCSLEIAKAILDPILQSTSYQSIDQNIYIPSSPIVQDYNYKESHQCLQYSQSDTLLHMTPENSYYNSDSLKRSTFDRSSQLPFYNNGVSETNLMRSFSSVDSNISPHINITNLNLGNDISNNHNISSRYQSRESQNDNHRNTLESLVYNESGKETDILQGIYDNHLTTAATQYFDPSLVLSSGNFDGSCLKMEALSKSTYNPFALHHLTRVRNNQTGVINERLVNSDDVGLTESHSYNVTTITNNLDNSKENSLYNSTQQPLSENSSFNQKCNNQDINTSLYSINLKSEISSGEYMDDYNSPSVISRHSPRRIIVTLPTANDSPIDSKSTQVNTYMIDSTFTSPTKTSKLENFKQNLHKQNGKDLKYRYYNSQCNESIDNIGSDKKNKDNLALGSGLENCKNFRLRSVRNAKPMPEPIHVNQREKRKRTKR